MSTFHISIPVSGLIRREDYTYEIVGLGANWPSVASPSSGSFTTNSRSASINTTISFLPTTGIDDLNVLPYSLLSCGYQDKEIFTRVAARVTSNSDNSVILSDSKLVNCSGCLPSINISITGCGLTNCDQYSLTNTNIFDFISSFSGLEPNALYSYNIRSIGSNWPVIMMSPMSGTFLANSNTYSLKHKLAFCPYSGTLCGEDNILNYDLSQCFNKNNLYANIELSLSPDYCAGERIFSNNILVNCKNCLPQTFSSLPPILSLVSSNVANITGSFSGLIPNTRYSYAFECVDSNWPSILKPISGSFMAYSVTDSVTAQLMFCSPSGDCVPGTENLLPYSVDTLADRTFNAKKLYTNLKLILSSECGVATESKECIIACDDCLSCFRYANMVFEGSPTVTLASGCCIGQKSLRVNVTNGVVGDRYTYQFSTVSGIGVNNISFNPSSGEIYFGSGGAGRINTICNVDLMNYSQTLLNCELTHTDTNNKVMDTVVLVCNSGC